MASNMINLFSTNHKKVICFVVFLSLIQMLPMLQTLKKGNIFAAELVPKMQIRSPTRLIQISDHIFDITVDLTIHDKEL